MSNDNTNLNDAANAAEAPIADQANAAPRVITSTAAKRRSLANKLLWGSAALATATAIGAAVYVAIRKGADVSHLADVAAG